MRRLSDHFKYSRPLEEGARAESSLPAEKPSERPPLLHGTFRGHPVWFHAAAASQNGREGALLRTDDQGQAFDPDDAIACVQYEHYVESGASGAGGDGKLLKSMYYLLKPLMPRAVQLELQRVNARRRLRSVRFPAWPQDSTLTHLLSAFLAERMRAAGCRAVPFLGFWPAGKTWAWGLTHDVDTHVGYAHLNGLARVEEDHGVRSVWYFVPERYPLDVHRLEEMRTRGHEIGVHGLQHSGKLFSSRAEFESRLPRINDYVHRWKARGFRSPATYRNPYWLPEIDVDYDSSYMDNATLEPQPGGVCAPFPFLLSERLVELPITLPMDHTLMNILRQDVVAACGSKLAWVRAQHGLALPLFHPDYNTSRHELEAYGRVVELLATDAGGWYALPWQIADWWQRRRQSSVLQHDGKPQIVAPRLSTGASGGPTSTATPSSSNHPPPRRSHGAAPEHEA